MSMYGDYECGALGEVEYHNLCVEENTRDRYEREEEEHEQDNIMRKHDR